MKNLSHPKERRGHPRIMMRFLANLRINENGRGYPGLTIDASESGLLIQTLKDMPVKTTLNIEVLFPKGFELSNFMGQSKSFGKISVIGKIWKDINMVSSLFRSQIRIIRC